MTTTPGWYPDPTAPGHVRWFDGSGWTEHVAMPDAARTAQGTTDRAQETTDRAAWVPAGQTSAAYTAPQAGYVPQAAAPSAQVFTPAGSGGVATAAPPVSWQQAGQPAAQPAPWQQAGQPAPWQSAPHGPAPGSQPSDALHWIVPTGRSWESIAAGYLGLLGLAVWLLAPFAVWTGVVAMRKARTGGHGRGRAVFGIVTGTIGTVIGVVVLVTTLTS